MQLFNIQEIKLVYQSFLNALYAFFAVLLVQQLLSIAMASSIDLKTRAYFLKNDYVIRAFEWNYEAVITVYFLPFLVHFVVLLLVAALFFIVRNMLPRGMRIFIIWYIFLTYCFIFSSIAAGILAKKEIYFFFSYFIFQNNLEAGFMYAFLGVALVLLLISAFFFRHSFFGLTHSISFLESMGTKRYIIFMLILPLLLVFGLYSGLLLRALGLYEAITMGLIAFAAFILYFTTPELVLVKRIKAGLPRPNFIALAVVLVFLIALRLYLRSGLII